MTSTEEANDALDFQIELNSAPEGASAPKQIESNGAK